MWVVENDGAADDCRLSMMAKRLAIAPVIENDRQTLNYEIADDVKADPTSFPFYVSRGWLLSLGENN